MFTSSFFEPKDIIQDMVISNFAKKELSKLTEDKVHRCIHNPKDGVIHENYCANCPTELFKNLIEFHSLKGELQDVQDKQNKARQKLYGHFRFIKQK